MDRTNVIGEKVKSLRTAKEISLEELADRTGLAVEQITRIEENIDIPWVSRNFVGIIFYTRKVLLTSHYEKRLFEYASQPRVAGSDIRLLSYLWS